MTTHDAIDEAQLAFVRTERTIQRTRAGRRLFMHPNGAPTDRLCRLTELCDELAARLFARVEALPDFATATSAQRAHALKVVEFVGRYGHAIPLTPDDAGGDVVQRAILSPLLRVVVTRREAHWAWPRAVPAPRCTTTRRRKRA